MKISLRSSRSSRLIFITLLFCLLIFLIHYPLTPRNKIKIDYECKLLNKSSNSCLFNCSFRVSEDSTLRVIVTHTVYAAIFDEEFEANANESLSLLIDLPRRNYVYNLRLGSFNQKNYGVGGGSLRC